MKMCMQRFDNATYTQLQLRAVSYDVGSDKMTSDSQSNAARTTTRRMRMTAQCSQLVPRQRFALESS